MSPARWNRMPGKAKTPRTRRPTGTGSWRCCGVNGCGEVLTGSWASVEKHLDVEHRGGRADAVFTLITTTGETR